MSNAVLVELADDLNAAYRSASSTSFGVFLRGKPSAQTLSEDAFADLIRGDVQQRLAMGLAIRLGDYAESPRVAGSPVLIDAAIQAVVRGHMARGMPRVEAFAMVKAEGLSLENEIETAQVLSSLLGSGSELENTPVALPRRIGPKRDDGQRRYEMTHQLGRGSQAVVYRAIDHELSTAARPSWVAVKLWRRGRGVGLHGRRLLTEAMQARRVEHPSVIKVYDAGLTSEGEAFMVTPIIEGRTLEAIRNGAGATVRAYAQWIRQVCDGVQAVHAVGLLHRDLKPSNIVIDAREQAIVTDLGLAVDMEAAEGPDGAGTLAFTAPEQWLVGGRTSSADVYAIAATLLWCLTGELPHGETREVAERVLTSPGAHEEAIAARLAKIEDVTLRAICGRGLAYDAGRRYATPEGLATDLAAWLANEPIAWTKPSGWTRVRLWRRRAPFQLALTAAAAAAIAAVPSVWLWGKLERNAAVAKEINDKFEQARDLVTATMRLMDAGGSDKWEDGCMPSLMLIESLRGPRFLNDEGVMSEVWDRRVDEAQRAKRDAGPATVAGMQWGALEALWAIQKKRYGEARTAMDDCLPRWEKVCEAGDPLLEDMQSLHAAAQVWAMYADREAAAQAGKSGEDLPDFMPEDAKVYEERLLRVVREAKPPRRLYYHAVNGLLRLYEHTWHNDHEMTAMLRRDAELRTKPPKAAAMP